MDRNKLWCIGSALVTTGLVLFGWLLGIAPQLDSISASDANRGAVQETNAGHVALLARLKHDFANLDTLTQTADALSESVPRGSAMPEFVDQLDVEAQGAGLTLTGLTVTDALAYTPIVAPTPAADSAAMAGGAPAASPSTTGASIESSGEPIGTALITATNFAAFPAQATVTGTYAQVLDFVSSLQSGKRLFLVHGLATTPTPGESGLVNATISGLVYSLVAPIGASAG